MSGATPIGRLTGTLRTEHRNEDTQSGLGKREQLLKSLVSCPSPMSLAKLLVNPAQSPKHIESIYKPRFLCSGYSFRKDALRLLPLPQRMDHNHVAPADGEPRQLAKLLPLALVE